MLKKFKNSYARLVIITIVSLVAGFHLLIYPEEVSMIVIRIVGFTWILDGIVYGLELLEKYEKETN